MGIGTRRDHTGGAKKTTLAADITTSSTSCTITDATGWPTGGVGPFFIVADVGLASEEKILVASRSSTTLTFQGGLSGRGQDGTSNTGHTANSGTWHPCWNAVEADELNAHIAASADVHGRTGSMVDTADVQTVANKTFNTSTWSGGTFTGTIAGSPTFSGAPGISDFTNAGHVHAAATSGGLLNTAAPTSSAVGDTSVTGTATTYSRTDHKHAREAFGGVVAETSFGQSSTAGVATTVSHSDHTHGTPADPIKIAPQFSKVTSNTAFGTTNVTVTSLSVTGDGTTRIMVTISWPAVQTQASGVSNCAVYIFRGATQIGRASVYANAGTTDVAGGSLSITDVPAAGANTYSFQVARIGGDTGTQLIGSSASPCELMVRQLY